MNVDLTEQDYRRLMMLAYLGEWMVNAIRKDPDPAYEDVLTKLYTSAQGTGLEPLTAYDAANEVWAPAEALEEEAHALIDDYDEKTFWEELTARLSERDMLEKFGVRAVGAMRPEERKRAAAKYAKAYTKEFEDHGLDRLGFAD